MDIITKAEAARRWNIDRAMVTRYTQRGLPVLENGKLDWQASDEWRKRNVVPQMSGSFSARELKRLDAKAAIAQLHGAEGIGGLTRLCVYFKLNGFQTSLAIDAILSWIWITLGDREMDRLFGLNGPYVDRSALTHLKLSKADFKRLDDLLPAIDAVLREQD